MRRKKLYYVPGLISLICLPILLWLFPLEEKVKHVAIQQFLAQPKAPKSSQSQVFSEDFAKKEMLKKKIKTIYLWNKNDCLIDDTGNENFKEGFDECSLIYFKILEEEIQRMKAFPNPNEALCVEFGNNNTYAEYVWVINLIKFNKWKRWVLIDDNLYILGESKPVKPEVCTIEIADIVCGTEKQTTNFQRFSLKVNYRYHYWKQIITVNKPIFYGFLCLIFLPWLYWFFVKRKRHKA